MICRRFGWRWHYALHSLLSVVGGTSLTGGEGSILGTVIGAAIMGVLRTGLNLVGVEAYWLPSAQGLIIILAIALDQWFRRCQGMRGGLSKLLADMFGTKQTTSS